jgi:translation initiation factor 3 subunit G
MAPAQQPKLRWGELEEDDGEDLDFLLPPRQVIGPDENGIKKVVEYRFNDEGNKVKITTTTRTRKLANARLSKRAIERRSWPKFGDAVHEDVGSRLTMVSTEEILLERPRAPGPSLSLSLSLAHVRTLFWKWFILYVYFLGSKGLSVWIGGINVI